MQAAVFTGTNRPLELETLEVDEPQAGEVRVRMLASGVCHSDLHVVEGEWRGASADRARPRGLRRGRGGRRRASTIVAAGDRVVLSWYAPCGACASCRRGPAVDLHRARSNDHLMPRRRRRLRRAGGEPVRPYLAVGSFGERAVVPAAAAVPVPAELPAEVGALIGCGVTTGVGAVVNTAAGRARRGGGRDRLRRRRPVRGAWARGWPAPTRSSPSTCTTRSSSWRATLGATHAVRGGDGAGAEVAAIMPDGAGPRVRGDRAASRRSSWGLLDLRQAAARGLWSG